MTAYAGNAYPIVALLDNAAVSSDVQPSTRTPAPWADRALSGTAIVSTDSNDFNEPIDVEPALPAAQAGGRLQSFGDLFFERIHLLPQRASYPFILSSQLIQLEVWNAYREESQTVTAVIETGPDGVTIVTPHGTPIVFAPLEDRFYTIEISSSGAPRADNTIRFDFAGIDEPLFTISGLRLIPFTITPDWDFGVVDDVAYATAVTVARDDTEQRTGLRVLPSRSMTYRAAGLDPREGGLLMALLHAWQGRVFGVILWMDFALLGADIASGNSAVVADTTNMGLVDEATVIVLADAFTWFASPVSDVTPTGFTFDTPADKNFTAGRAIVARVLLGRIADAIPVERPTNATASTEIRFDLDAVVA